jgi:threonine dehydrogenase-like Zn-dependent dehydrogenase
VPERLALARETGAETIDFMKEDVYDRIMELTKGRGADACIDAVGTEADPSASLDSRWDRIKVATFMGTDRPHVLRQAIHCCRNFGTVSIVGVYGGFLDKIPMGSAINRGLTFRMAQTPVQHYLPRLLERIEKGDIDPSFVVTHTAPLEKGPELYKTFRDKQDGCIKVVLKPGMKDEAEVAGKFPGCEVVGLLQISNLVRRIRQPYAINCQIPRQWVRRGGCRFDEALRMLARKTAHQRHAR